MNLVAPTLMFGGRESQTMIGNGIWYDVYADVEVIEGKSRPPAWSPTPDE